MVFSIFLTNFQVVNLLVHMRYLYSLLLVVIFAGCKSSLPYTNVQIDVNYGDGYGPCEPSIAIDPNNPNRMVAGAVLDRAYYSEDGGQTWSKQQISSSFGVWGDPVVIADFKGNFYYFHLSFPSGIGGWEGDKLDRMVCQKSTDGGKTWSDGSYTGLFHPKDQDKEWAVVDPANNNIYMTWTQFDAYGSDNPEDRSNILFSKSEDEGASWSPAIQINQFSGDCIDDDQTTEGAVPAVGPDGSIYVAWALNDTLYFDRSTDQGETWLQEDLIVSDQPQGWDQKIPGVGRANGLPITLCDLSQGPNRGRIYVNWSDQRSGENDTDIWLAYSDDQGLTWSSPKRVNDDRGKAHQFFPWATIDQSTGHLYIVYYDRRKTSGTTTNVYLAISKDGGQTFQNQRINEKSFEGNTQVFFGDYNNIVAVDGKVRPIWTQVDGLDLSIWTALIDF